MLTEYRGGSNSREVFRHILGERIVAAFEDEKGHVVLVMESGPAIVFGGRVDGLGPTYWTTSKEDIDMLVAERRKAIEGRLAELRDIDMPGLP
jgi:hypothetical protein